MFEIKIEENLDKFHRQKIYPPRPGQTTPPNKKTNKRKLFHQHKWNIIKRHWRIHQDRCEQKQIQQIHVKRRHQSVEELLKITTHIQMVGNFEKKNYFKYF